MGEALLTRPNVSGSDTPGEGGALLNVYTSSGATVVVSNGTKTMTKSTSSLAQFTVTFGTWNVQTSYSSGMVRKSTLTVEVYQVYTLRMPDKSTYGISINMATSDPATAVTYTDDAVGLSPLSCNSGGCNYGDWKDIIYDTFGCKPCLYSAGSRTAYLNRDNYSLTESGGSADITSGGSGDVMVEFKRTWYKFGISGNVLTFQVADYDRSSDGFVSDAFYSNAGNSVIKDYMYYGAYEGCNESSKLRSLSGKTPTRNITIGTSRTYAKNIGTAYGIEDWAKRCYILGLLMLVTKTRGIQAVIGNGICDSNAALMTGTMNTAGLFYGGSSSTGCKVFGIEHFWGNYWKWCDGLVTTGSSGTIKMKNKSPYTDAGSGYTTVSGVMPHGSSGYPTQMKPFFSGAMIFPSLVQSNNSIGWPDSARVNSNASCVAYVGGLCSDDAGYAGPFYVYVYYYASRTDDYFAARLVAA